MNNDVEIVLDLEALNRFRADTWDEGHRAALELFPARPEDNPYRQDQP